MNLLPAVLPDSLEGWRVSFTPMWGEQRWTARQNGTTVLFIRREETGPWELARYRAGRCVATATTTELPPGFEAALKEAPHG